LPSRNICMAENYSNSFCRALFVSRGARLAIGVKQYLAISDKNSNLHHPAKLTLRQRFSPSFFNYPTAFCRVFDGPFHPRADCCIINGKPIFTSSPTLSSRSLDEMCKRADGGRGERSAFAALSASMAISIMKIERTCECIWRTIRRILDGAFRAIR
jgi:hypothetical protein